MAKLALIPRTLRAPAFLVPLGVLALFACNSPATPRVTGNIDVTVWSLLTAPISSLRVTVQSPTTLANSLKIPLAFKSDQSSVLLRNLGVASDYVLTADALDGNSVIIAHGLVSGVAITKGQTTKVIIYLHQVIVPPPFSNSAPLIDAIALSTDVAAPSGQVQIAGLAHDPDDGQTATLGFSWSAAASCGTISNIANLPGTDALHPSQSLATWTAPQAQGNCQITLTAKDVLGLSTSATFTMRVGAEAAGAADVALVFNEGPVIVAITSSPAQLSSTGPTNGVVEAIATDPEDDNLSYTWGSDPNSPCAVEFVSPDAAASAFTATPTVANATFCTFILSVSDGTWPDGGVKKNTSLATLTLAMTAPVVALVPPTFGVAYQSYDTATDGVLVMFGAIAFDPEGGTLVFAWSASQGSPPNATDPPLLGLDPAFSTAAVWTPPAGSQILTSDLRVLVTATSSTTNLQSTLTFSLKPADAP